MSSTTSAVNRPLVVGVGVMNYFGWYGFRPEGKEIYDLYVSKLTKFVSHLIASGHSVHILTGETTDCHAVNDLLGRVGKANGHDALSQVTGGNVVSLTDLMTQIDETDVVVATRYHNIVCALKLGKPTISLAYSKKNDVLMTEMGQGAFCHNVEAFGVDELIRQFDNLASTITESARSVREKVGKAEERLQHQEAALRSAVL
jgi:polysaccharide pyruvyl transferase WcaK-like protein